MQTRAMGRTRLHSPSTNAASETRTILTVETIYGTELARFECGEIGEAVIVVPGLGENVYVPLQAQLRSFGVKDDTHVNVGPLLRFKVKRIAALEREAVSANKGMEG